MKKTASVFSWLGGAAQTLISAISILSIDYGWLWGFFAIGVIIRLIVLICRENCVNDGKKIGCGVFTLLFASFIGGILTLCIPEEELNPQTTVQLKHYEPYQHTQNNQQKAPPFFKVADNPEKQSTNNTGSLNRESERIKILSQYNDLLEKGIITREEFDSKKKELLS